MARNFNGTSDFITLSGSTQVYNSNFGGVFAVVRRTSNTNWGGVFNVARTSQFGSADFTSFDVAASSAADPNALTGHYSAYKSAGPAFTLTAADGWAIIGFTKPTGVAQTVRFHKYLFSTNTWTHTNGTGDDNAGLGSGIQSAIVNIGRADGVNYWAGDIDIVAMYPANKSDVEVETLSTNLAAWTTLSPSGLWHLDQASTATSVTDSTGNGSNQTALSGTSVVAGSPLSAVDTVSLASVGSLSFMGVAETFTVEDIFSTQVGGFSFSGISPTLLIEEVVEGTGPTSLFWMGVSAVSVAATPSSDVAHVGSLAWCGLPAISASYSAGTGGPASDPRVACPVGSHGRVRLRPYA